MVFGYRGIVVAKLLAEVLEVIARVTAIRGRQVDQEQEQSATLGVTQKSVAKSSILRRPLDQTGNIRHRDGTKVIGVIDHPDGRNQGREGIGINLRTGVGKNVEESRFSRIREPYQPDVGDCL